MAARLETLAIDLERTGWGMGGKLVREYSRDLLRKGYIPQELDCERPVVSGTIGEQLKQYRNALKYSQRELATKTALINDGKGVDYSTLSRIENENREPTIGTLCLLVLALKLNPNQILNLLLAPAQLNK